MPLTFRPVLLREGGAERLRAARKETSMKTKKQDGKTAVIQAITGDKPPLVAIDWGNDVMVDVESSGSAATEANFVLKHLEQGRAVRRLNTGLPVVVVRGGVAEVVFGDAHIIDLDNPDA